MNAFVTATAYFQRPNTKFFGAMCCKTTEENMSDLKFPAADDVAPVCYIKGEELLSLSKNYILGGNLQHEIAGVEEFS